MEYQDFLASKHLRANASGFDAGDLNPNLFPWQAEVVRWACKQGKAAIFAECGLGKTLMQLAWAEQVCELPGLNAVLILTPLAVARQTEDEAGKFGIKANVRVVESQSEVVRGINIANYHKLHKFDTSVFAGVVLDESSILKSFMGKTKRALIDAFSQTPYRLACTATPSPNDFMELGNHAEFLGVMPSSEMLARWFINDLADTGKYRVKGHAEKDFWAWVASWAACVSKPSDLGYPDDGYELPDLDVRQVVVEVDLSDDTGEKLFRGGDLNATNLHAEMRRTAKDRAAVVAELVRENEGPWVLWCNTNYEADELRRAIPEAVEVRGSDSDEKKESVLAGFADGTHRVIVTKAKIAGFGLNWQHCSNVAFVGLSYSFEQYYQAVRRCWRFGQKRPVKVHIVMAETETAILSDVLAKQGQHQRMISELAKATRASGGVGRERCELTQVQSSVASGGAWTLHLGDAVETLEAVEDASIDFTIFSPPFSNLYIYSDSAADMGNSADDAEFMQHFGFLVPELLRVTTPGRLCAVHCKDLPRYAGRDGTAGLKDFPGELIRLFTLHGWSYHSRVTIWKCPVVERERTNNNGLLHKTIKRDSSQVRQGMADFLLVFRRPPEGTLLSDKPIVRAEGLEDYHGDCDPRQSGFHPSPFSRHPSDDPALAIWQRYAEPVWWDIDQMDVLNYRIATSEKDEKHICPLQLGLIRRAVHLWSNPGDTVLSPFAGVGSEGVVAVEEGRRFVGVELKPEYWKLAQKHLGQAEEKANQLTLFDNLAA